MYDNIGEKLKTLARSLCVILIIGAIIGGVVFIFSGLFLLGILEIVVGTILSWASTLLIYGVGEAVTNTEEIKNETYILNKKANRIESSVNHIKIQLKDGNTCKDNSQESSDVNAAEDA